MESRHQFPTAGRFAWVISGAFFFGTHGMLLHRFDACNVDLSRTAKQQRLAENTVCMQHEAT
jgi:hypothetical protein